MQTQTLWMLLILTSAPLCARAQWLHNPTPGTPRAPDGKPNLAARAPRTSNGKPDLTGVWLAEPASIEELMRMAPGGVSALGEGLPSKYFVNILADFKPEDAPLLPAAAESYRQHLQSAGKDFQTSRCLPAGVPAANLLPIPFKLIQTPQQIVLLYEADTTFRQIFTDGRKLPDDPQPSWLGYSVGRWEGDWMVVDSAGFNDKAWLDAFGHIHSDALRVTERFHRRDFGHMQAEVRLDDPKTFTKPVTVRFNLDLIPDTELLETFCPESEKDLAHLPAK
jgi:hypothetical protein